MSILLAVLGCQTAPKYTSVREAIQVGDTKRLSQMLDDDPRVATGDALATAARHTNTAAAVLLLAHGVDACGPLFPAAEAGAVSVVRTLLAHGAQVNATNGDCETPLHAAARNGNPEIVRLLLEHGAGPYLPNRYMGDSALHVAASNGHAVAVALLLAAGVPVNSTNCVADTPLHLAAKSADYETLAVLLAHGADANRRGDGGATALHIVAGKGRRDLARLLIAKGASVNVRDMNQWTALHWAADAKQFATAQYLLRQGAEVDLRAAAMLGHTKRIRELLAQDSTLANKSIGDGLTVLHRAAIHGHREIVELLLAAGADINATSQDNATPLMGAIHNGHDSLAEYLISKGADVHGNFGWTPLLTGARAGRVEMIQMLLRHGADVNATRGRENETPLLLALDHGHDRAVRVLLAAGANTRGLWPETDTNSIGGNSWRSWQRLQIVKRVAPWAKVPPFPEANIRNTLYGFAWNGRADLALKILQSGIPMDASDKHMLMVAAGEGKQKQIMDWVWRSGFDPNHGRNSLLTHAAVYGRRELLASLIKHGADINAKDAGGQTPLGWAIRTIGEFDVASLLLDAGANVNVASKAFGYPLAHAASVARPLLVQRLLALGAAAQAADEEGRTALHQAIFPAPDPITPKLQERVVRLLLDAGADVHAKDNQGVTPLDRAAEYGTTNLAKLLLSEGAALDIFTAAGCGATNFVAAAVARDPALVKATKANGTTPLHWAVRTGQESAAELLLKAGADANAKDREMQTPLWMTASRNHPGMVPLLAAHGADLNAVSWNNTTPLEWAIANDGFAVAEELIACGADPHARAQDGQTLLHKALCSAKKAGLGLLLAKGVDPNGRDRSGKTPLFLAVQFERLDATKVLLAHGADPTIADNSGLTPIQLAERNKLTEISDCLRRRLDKQPHR